ncbi:MAG: hypothetical protein WD009_10450 [Phycisphaeraceae bacterium]
MADSLHAALDRVTDAQVHADAVAGDAAPVYRTSWPHPSRGEVVDESRDDRQSGSTLPLRA